MKYFAILLICLVAFSSATGTIRKKKNKQALQQARTNAFRHWMSYDYNYDYANTLSKEAAKNTGCDAFDVKPYLSVRTNKFEAAMSLAVQNNPAMIAILKEMIQRELCVVRVAFPDDATLGIDENFRREHLFALPNNVVGQAEAQWVASFRDFSPFDAWTKSWINLDNSRSGMWVTDDLKTNLDYLENLITKGNTWRELLHTLTRASLYGEDIADRSKLRYHAAYSLRHAIYVILNDSTKLTTAKNTCGFEVVDGKKTLFHKKSYFGSYKNTSVDKARLKGDKAFRGMSKKDNKQANSNPYYAYRMTVNPKAVGCDAFPTKLTPNALNALNMPPISAAELNYFQRFYHMKPDDKPGLQKWVPLTGDDPVPWGYGACVWDMDSKTYKWNKEWVDAMNENGLAIDAGPSGTTDEILSVGDWMGLTSNGFAFCALRDVAIALMPIAEHHSLGEIIQGAYDGVRAVGAGLKDFKFSDPWESIHWCDGRTNDFVTKFVKTQQGAFKLPDSVHRFQTALSIAQISSDAAPWTTIESATDYASEPVPHKFKDTDVAVERPDWGKFCGCMVGTTPFSGVGMSKANCIAASNSMAAGCAGYSNLQLGDCGGIGAGKWGTATTITWPTTKWTKDTAFKFP